MVMMNKREMSSHGDTELRLGLPGSKEVVDNQSFPKTSERKRSFSNMSEELAASCMTTSPNDHDLSQPIKVQAIGWPPVKSYRKNCLQATKRQDVEATSIYVKVSMDGAPYLRKIDLRLYKSYKELLKALEDMFILKDDKPSKRSDTKNNGSEYKPTYEDKDGDWMLVGDVPWEMFLSSCKRLRIMKLGSEPKDLACLS